MAIRARHCESGRRWRRIGAALGVAWAFAGSALAPLHAQEAPATPAPTPPAAESKPAIPPAIENDPEIMLGRQNVEQLEKETKLYTEAAAVERVNRIGQELATLANTIPIPALWGTQQQKQLRYVFKIVDDKDVNAFSLPGGFIYVNKGLLDMVRSDDELAGVLAHEVAHAAHHHVVKLIKEQKKVNQALLPIQLLAVLLAGFGGGSMADIGTVFQATNFYSIAKTNSYGVDAEIDADHMAVILMTKSKYNPVGVYSFMRRLAEMEKRFGGVELGIYRTHPPGEERREAAQKTLAKLNIPIRLSDVDPTLKAQVTVTKSGVGGIELAEIRLQDILICRVPGSEGLTAQQRAVQLANRFNELLDTRLQPFEIRLNREQTRLMARGQTLLTKEDAAAQNGSLTTIAREMADAVTRISQKRQIRSDY